VADASRFYIDGQWVAPAHPGAEISVINPATEEEVARIAAATPDDVEAAVQAAHRAFDGWSQTGREERIEVLTSLREAYKKRIPLIAEAMMTEVGIPRGLAFGGQVLAGARHLKVAMDALRAYPLEQDWGATRIRREPVGVCALLAPWNWPMNQVTCKVGPALAAGCTVVLKPSQLSPLSALLFAEAADEAGVPAGVFNMLNGAGAALGDAFAAHPLVDMVSLTGSTAVGGVVGAAAAPSIKRVSLELGGKSANIVFADADLDRAAPVAAFLGAALLSGQGCALPTRLFVHDDVYDEVVDRVVGQLEGLPVGDPLDRGTIIGPVVNETACQRILGVIDRAQQDGATLLTGGRRLDDDRAAGYFVAPTVFGDVRHGSDLATHEVFGPVLAVLRFSDEDEVLAMANDSDFGLAAYLHTRDLSRAMRMANGLDAGTVTVNGFPAMSPSTPFGGMKASGFGREGGRHGIEEFVQRKNVTFRY
jgi:aldehyde dehydrogenase (NAD+)